MAKSYRFISCLLILSVTFISANVLAQTGTGANAPAPGSQAEQGVIAVIYPVQSATIGSPVRGILGAINYKEGERVKGGAVVAEVSKPRYSAILGEFRSNYQAVSRTLERARKELEIQEDLWEKRATTYDDLLRAQSQVRILESRKSEASFKMKQAEIDLEACILNAPFSGYVAVLYRDPHETVDFLEKVFEIVDTSKVYARANWPESRLGEVEIGKGAVFTYKGKDYEGEIEKVSSLIDPASKSKRVHALIDNSRGDLEVGMSGRLRLP